MRQKVKHVAKKARKCFASLAFELFSPNLFNKFNNAEAQMLDLIYLIYDIKVTLKSHFWCENILKDFVIMKAKLLWTL